MNGEDDESAKREGMRRGFGSHGSIIRFEFSFCLRPTDCGAYG